MPDGYLKPMHIVPLYASILALMFVGLSVRTLRMRGRLGIAIGDAGNPQMLRAMRVHSNFAEYVPLGLLLVYFVETGGASPVFVHVLGLCLVAGRASHAFGVSRIDENFRFRVFGMAMTFVTLVAAPAYLIHAYVGRMIA
jgi:uncharacterized protein